MLSLIKQRNTGDIKNRIYIANKDIYKLLGGNQK